jgi:hypothetical protein
MLALSIQQPWAHVIINGLFHGGEMVFKDVENRTWYTAQRGTFQVHAAKKINLQAIDWLKERFPGASLPTEWKTGGIIGIVDAVDCVKSHKSRWFSGPFGILLANPYPVPFVPCTGALGFFDPTKFNAKT